MATVKYANPTAKISGKFSGNVFSRDKSGNRVRCAARRVKRRTSAQLIQRAAFMSCRSYANENADAAFYGAWTNYASLHPATNRLGESVRLSWWHCFLRINLSRVANGLPIRHYPPGVPWP